MRFVDVKNDVAFRKIFGNENKTEIVISFLNAMLKLKGDRQIVEATLVNPYQLPRVAGEKASIIDVRIKDKQKRQYIVEMQVADVDGFDKRVQYYTCRDYSMQIDRGEKYPELNPTYFVGILDFNFFESKGYLSHHIIVDELTHEHKLKDIQFTFIELKKFDLKVNELQTLMEKWVFFIKNAANLKVIPANVDDEGLNEAYKDAEKHNWEKEELIAYDNASIAEQDRRGRMTRAIDKAVGKAVSKAVDDTKKEMVKKCYQKGMTIADIIDVTGLPEETVREIIAELNGNI